MSGLLSQPGRRRGLPFARKMGAEHPLSKQECPIGGFFFVVAAPLGDPVPGPGAPPRGTGRRRKAAKPLTADAGQRSLHHGPVIIG